MSVGAPPAISVVIVNWNTAELVTACLRSLQGLLGPGGAEVIVVDNASADNSRERLAREFPQVRLLANADNAGFARANNQALALCQGRYAILLNPDTVVPPGSLEALAAFMDSRPQAGACGPRLQRPDGTPQPFAFGGDPSPAYLAQRAARRLLGARPMHDWATDQVQRVDWVAGTCLCVRRAALDKVGLLDEAMFMYFEDNDWCRRLRQEGWHVYYNPRVAITHLGGQSLQQNPAARHAYEHSLRHFYRKHYGRLAQWWLTLMLPLYRRAVPV